jgi:hypothetical protein
MTPNLTRSYVGRPLLVVLALFLIMGATLTVFSANRPLSHMLDILLTNVGSYVFFVWFCRDSDAYRYRRSWWRNVGFIFMAVLFVPWYLVRTRPKGSRFFAFLMLGGFCILCVFAILAGVILGMLFQP